MVLDPYRWVELRRFLGLLESGAMSLSEIARETGLDRRTVRKYLAGEGPASPPRRASNGPRQQRVIDEFAPLIDSMLRAEILMKATVIHERLASDYGFTGNYQRVALYVQEARPRIAGEFGITPKELAGMHRRFEVIPGAQAQVDWGDEGMILAHMGIPKVYSFHMTLSYSRDPFCCFITSQDLQTFIDCHRRAFPDLDPRKVKDLATLSFVEAKANAALLGPPEVGKTHIAVALAVAACRAGYLIYFTSLDDMVRNLKAAEAAGRLLNKLGTYLRPSVLVVDEVGYQPLERAEANLVFQVISKRYEKGSIILTSNKMCSEWGQVFGDEVLATSILDRLLHHCEVISINGPSYRLKAIERDTDVA
ncbi:IS21-like element helper ATPase IstB [Streptomyces sp. NPDC014995]|uniref:IS21-like element helper ATPase IstB n=1 Tax=Streptomyces sp. NPDC014995 TaxID=3364936 RepID=UPI0036F7F0D7